MYNKYITNNKVKGGCKMAGQLHRQIQARIDWLKMAEILLTDNNTEGAKEELEQVQDEIEMLEQDLEEVS